MPGHVERLRSKSEMTAYLVLVVTNARRSGISLAGAVLLLQEAWTQSAGAEEICRELDAAESKRPDDGGT